MPRKKVASAEAALLSQGSSTTRKCLLACVVFVTLASSAMMWQKLKGSKATSSTPIKLKFDPIGAKWAKKSQHGTVKVVHNPRHRDSPVVGTTTLRPRVAKDDVPGWNNTLASGVHRYALLGQGFCNKGYYAGWNASEALDAETCQRACSSESQCVFTSLKVGLTCSRYDATAGLCNKRDELQPGYTTYRKELPPCNWTSAEVVQGFRCSGWFEDMTRAKKTEAESFCQSTSACKGLHFLSKGNLSYHETTSGWYQACSGQVSASKNQMWSIVLKPQDCDSPSDIRLEHKWMPPQVCPTSIKPTKPTSQIPTSIDFVVAAFNEDLSFINPMMSLLGPSARLQLYCSGNITLDPRCQASPNRGGENHVYLRHIVQNYDKLADVTVFSVGSVMRHHNEELLCRKLNYVIDKVNQKSFSGFATMAHTKPGEFNDFMPSFDIKKYNSQKWGGIELCRSKVAPLGNWFQHFVEKDLTRAVCAGVTFNGVFAASRERIHRWPLQTYQGLLQELGRCGEMRGVADHYMERAWKAMLDDETTDQSIVVGANRCPIKKQILRECVKKNGDNPGACPGARECLNRNNC
eukprot:TRINITY_DN60718_c0_g1_i1.p1 TRINITY_DN60718_c0_g1~~TRINITY_DN60718_c0_g1_i1.p1  ORF type:complete len:578 (-),score=107.98 TRINITY_DN60718_c0_g1_i1:10-1743(-)